MKVPVL